MDHIMPSSLAFLYQKQHGTKMKKAECCPLLVRGESKFFREQLAPFQMPTHALLQTKLGATNYDYLETQIIDSGLRDVTQQSLPNKNSETNPNTERFVIIKANLSCKKSGGLYVSLRICEPCKTKYVKATYNLAPTLDCHMHYWASDTLSQLRLYGCDKTPRPRELIDRRVYLVLKVSDQSLRQSCERDTDHHIFKTKLESLIGQQLKPGDCSKESLGAEAQGCRISTGCAVLVWSLSCVFAKV